MRLNAREVRFVSLVFTVGITSNSIPKVTTRLATVIYLYGLASRSVSAMPWDSVVRPLITGFHSNGRIVHIRWLQTRSTGNIRRKLSKVERGPSNEIERVFLGKESETVGYPFTVNCLPTSVYLVPQASCSFV